MLRILHAVQTDIRHSADDVDRCADIMAHTAQEICLCCICEVRPLRRLAKLILIIQLFLFLLRDIANQKHDCQCSFFFVAALRYKQCLIPLSGYGLEALSDKMTSIQSAGNRFQVDETCKLTAVFLRYKMLSANK